MTAFERGLDREIVKAAATDAGNKSMRAAGRTAWSVDDWNVAADEHYRRSAELYHRSTGKP